MGFLPKPPASGSNDYSVGGASFVNAVPDDESGKLFIDLIKSAHRILKNVVARDVEATNKEGKLLEEKIQNLDLSNKATRVAILSMVMSLAAMVPPSIYGGDDNMLGNL